jgi:hypothetical protein
MTVVTMNKNPNASTQLSIWLSEHLQPNRVVAFFGPVISILAGVVASWLGRHLPGLHLNTGTAAGTITQRLKFAIGALVTLALQHRWLDGWQKWEAMQPPVAATGALTPAGEYDPTRDMPTEIADAVARGASNQPADGSGQPERRRSMITGIDLSSNNRAMGARCRRRRSPVRLHQGKRGARLPRPELRGPLGSRRSRRPAAERVPLRAPAARTNGFRRSCVVLHDDGQARRLAQRQPSARPRSPVGPRARRW